MSKNKISKDHHYIPQFFLNSFAIKEGKKYIINVFNKNSGKKFSNSVDNIAYIKNFHTVKINGKETDIFEKAHNEIYEKKLSMQYKSLLRKLEMFRQDINIINCLSTKRCLELYDEEQLSNEEKIFLSFLIAYFIIRGKKWREFGEEAFSKMEEIIKEYGKAYNINNIEEIIRNKIGTVENVKLTQIQKSFEVNEVEEFSKYFYEHKWNIGLNMTKDYFYTSDNGHALTTMWNEQPACYGIGYNTYGNIVIFPISPKICIIMYDSRYVIENNLEIIDKNFVILNEEQVKIINNKIISSSLDQVYSIDGNWRDLDEYYKR